MSKALTNEDGQISLASPVGHASLGKRAGDTITLRRPKGDVEVTVVSVGLPHGGT